MQSWDAAAYDERFGVITRYGAGVLELLDVRPGMRVLDLGCGPGRHAAELAASGAEVVGIDSDAAMIARARQLHAHVPGVRFAQADSQRLDPDAWGRFDAVFSNAALHWMPDQDAVLTGVRAVLAPGGRFVGEMGADGNVAAVTAVANAVRSELGLAPASGGWVFPTVADHARRLEHHGLRPDLLHRFGRPTPLAAGETVATWLRMFAPAFADDVDDRDAFDRRVDELAVERGLVDDDGVTVADYVRLRFTATAV